MEVEGLSLGTISTLPRDITNKILSLLPIQDVLRTSILSKNWRYRWTSIHVLVFDDTIFEGSSQYKEVVKYKFANAIYHVLLAHSGPLVEFTLLCKVDMAFEIDHIILYLSRSNTLKKLTLINSSGNNYKLPSSFFSLQGLEDIDISNFHFEPPLTFNGFSMLTLLWLSNVDITAVMLKRFLTNCPLVTDFYLLGKNKDIARGNKLTFVDLFESLPSVVVFALSMFHIEYFAAGGVPHKLPISLVHLRILFLGLCFMKKNWLLSALCLIKNSPYLLELHIGVDFQPTCMDDIDLKDYSSLKLDYLVVFEIISFNNSANEMEFVKLIMAKSHMLELVRIVLSDHISVDEEMKMFRDLIQVPFPRASPSAKLTIERQEPSS